MHNRDESCYVDVSTLRRSINLGAEFRAPQQYTLLKFRQAIFLVLQSDKYLMETKQYCRTWNMKYDRTRVSLDRTKSYESYLSLICNLFEALSEKQFHSIDSTNLNNSEADFLKKGSEFCPIIPADIQVLPIVTVE